MCFFILSASSLLLLCIVIHHRNVQLNPENTYFLLHLQLYDVPTAETRGWNGRSATPALKNIS